MSFTASGHLTGLQTPLGLMPVPHQICKYIKLMIPISHQLKFLELQPSHKKGLHSLRYNISFICSPSCDFYVYFHFAEIVKIPQDQRREFTITLNGLNYGPVSLEYLKPQTIPLKSPTQGDINFTINPTSNSDLPPILSAFEILSVLKLPLSPTDQSDGMFFTFVFNCYIYQWQ